MKKDIYTVRADGWVAGKWRARGSAVSLSAAEAKYENVTPKKDALTGSADDPAVKSTGLAGQAKADPAKRGRASK